MFTSFHKFSDAWWKIADGQAFLLCAEDFEIKQNEREKPCLHSLKLLVYIYISQPLPEPSLIKTTASISL